MNFKKEQFAEILQTLSDRYGSINKLAKKSGVTASYISKLIRLQYNSPPSPEILQKLANNSFDFTSYNHLMYICGYLDNTKPNKNNNLDNPKTNVNNYSINLNFILYDKLDETGQEKVNDYIKDLTTTNKYNKKN